MMNWLESLVRLRSQLRDLMEHVDQTKHKELIEVEHRSELLNCVRFSLCVDDKEVS